MLYEHNPKKRMCKISPLNCQNNSIDYRTIALPIWASPQKEKPPRHFGRGGVCSKLKETILETIYETRSVRASAPTAEQTCEICTVGCAVTVDIATSGSPCGEHGCQVRTVANTIAVEIAWA